MPIPIMRPYQDDLLNRGRRLMAQGVKRVIFQAMVGAGKGPMIGEVSRSAAAKGKRVLLLVHRRRLIGQLSRELDGFEVPHGVLMNGVPTKPSERIQVASKDTLISRAITNTWIKPPPADLVIVDECHNLPSKGYTDLAEVYPDAYHMGFTATPARADGKGLGDFYKAMECCIPTSELIKYGHIVPVKAYAPNQIGRKSKKTKREVGGDPVSHWLRLGENRPTIAFCKSVAASKWLMNAFLMAGVVAEHLDAHTDDEDRDAMLNRLATGETQVVTNCSCLTEGVNVPVASCLIMLRMAASYTFYIQMMGRVMRAAPGKTHAIVLDHSDSVPHHGFPDQDVRWELTTSETIEDRNKKDRKDGKLKKPIACPACGICYEGTITCPACGFMLPRKLQTPELKRQLLTEVPREEITPEDLLVRKERYWKSCLAIAAHKGGKCSMAGAMYKRNFGEWPSGSFRHAPRGSDWHRKVGDVFPQFLEARSA